MRKRILVAALTTCALLGTACSKPAEGPAPERERTPAPITETTTIRVAYRRDGGTMISNEIDAFQMQFPQYRVEQVTFLNEDLAELLIDQQIDVVLPINDTLVKAGLLLDLEPYLRNSDLDINPFGEVLGGGLYEGKRYGLPYVLLVGGLMYNQRAQFQLGISDPVMPGIWEEFRTVLQSLVSEQSGQKVPGFRRFPDQEGLVTDYLESKAGGRLHTISEVDLREALVYFQTLIFTDQSLPMSEPRDFADPNSDYAAPLPLPSEFPPLSNAYTADLSAFQVFPLPAYRRNERPIVEVVPVSVGIAANSAEAQAAWAFVEFLVGEAGAAMAARRSRVPAYHTETVLQAWRERSNRKPETDDLLTAALLGGQRTEEQEQLYRVIWNAANRVFSGAMTVDESIAQWRLDIASLGQ